MSLFKKEDSGAADNIAPGSREGLSVIGVGVKVIGDIQSVGVLKIEGYLEGCVRGARQLLLGRNGVILGSIEAEDVVIGGTVQGNIDATSRLEIQASSLVNGDVRAKTLIVAEGGRINGYVRTSNADEESMPQSRLKIAASGG